MQFIAVLLFVLAASAAPAQADHEALLGAARAGDTEAVRTLLAAGDSPNPPAYHRGYSPLQFAAGNGHVAMTRLLLAAGADTGYRDHNGDRALLWAAQRGQDETVALLLSAGSPTEADDPYGQTPLMHAARNGHAEVARLLVEAGADVHRIEQGGDTALHFAARSGDTGLVRLLLEAGANPNVFDTILFETPLHEAVVRGDADMVRELLAAGAGTDPRDEKGRTPLFLAASFGRLDAAEALIAAHAGIDAADLAGLTPVLAAMDGTLGEAEGRMQVAALLATYTRDVDRAFAAALAAGLPSSAMLLLVRGADIGSRDQWGQPALANAVAVPGMALFEALLARGADLERDGAEALHAAAAAARTDIAALLLERGVAVDVASAEGATPLMVAAYRGHVAMVRLLLDAGADPGAVDTAGLDIERHMRLQIRFIDREIGTRSASRAWRPVDHLESARRDLQERYAAIRKLLAKM